MVILLHGTAAKKLPAFQDTVVKLASWQSQTWHKSIQQWSMTKINLNSISYRQSEHCILQEEGGTTCYYTARSTHIHTYGEPTHHAFGL